MKLKQVPMNPMLSGVVDLGQRLGAIFIRQSARHLNMPGVEHRAHRCELTGASNSAALPSHVRGDHWHCTQYVPPPHWRGLIAVAVKLALEGAHQGWDTNSGITGSRKLCLRRFASRAWTLKGVKRILTSVS